MSEEKRDCEKDGSTPKRSPKLDLILQRPPTSLSVFSAWPVATSQFNPSHPLRIEEMNLTLYAITAFIILDTDGNRVLSKYYRQENNPSSSKGLANTKEQRAFEKGLWQKTKKSGGTVQRQRHHLPILTHEFLRPPDYTRAPFTIRS